MNGWGYLYKVTGLRPSQYPNTGMSLNQFILHKYHRFQLHLGVKD